ncbi:MAG: exodeoxyribonuclease VII small subunit [bacterium]|jgi:exodeoxyribonuclease VII small subunit
MNNEARQPVDFEKGMARLEEIISHFDDGGLTLDQMEQYFLEGMQLIEDCSARLDRFEIRVNQLLKDYDQDWKETSFSSCDDED